MPTQIGGKMIPSDLPGWVHDEPQILLGGTVPARHWTTIDTQPGRPEKHTVALEVRDCMAWVSFIDREGVPQRLSAVPFFFAAASY